VIEAAIFDLDNCLAPADEVGRKWLEPMFAAIRRANSGRLPDSALERAFEDCWRLPLDVVAQTHGFSDEMLAAGWAAARGIVVRRPMTGYELCPVRALRCAVARQICELRSNLFQRQPDSLREHDEGDESKHRARIAAMAGIGALGGDQPLLFVKAQRRGRHTAAARHLADGQCLAHAFSLRHFRLDFKCT